MRKTFTIAVMAALLAVVIPFNSQAAVRYVAAGGTGDGTSWATATGDLQAAIEASAAGDEVWVAQGTYKPDSLIRSNRANSRAFFLKDGVSLYGGFAGNETSKEARQMGASGKPYDFAHETILSGDDDVPDVWQRVIAAGTTYRNTWNVVNDEVPGTANNASHVLYQADVISNHTIIDGFTLTGGNANDYRVRAAGGAVYAQGNVSIKACKVTKNAAYFKAQSMYDSNTYGGAVYLNGARDASIEDCLFDSNYSHSSYGNGVGGAVYAQNVATRNCEFVDCVGEDGGGGIYNSKGTLAGCTFTRCYGSNGGAVYNTGTATDLTVYSCQGLLGGGIYNEGSLTHVKVYNCYADAEEFGKELGGRGGGIYNFTGGTVIGAVAYNNKAFRGAGVFMYGGSVVNSTIQNNSLREETDSANIGFANAKLSADSVYNTIGNPDAAAANFVQPTAFKGLATTAADSLALHNANWSLAAGSAFIDSGSATQGVTEAADIAGTPRPQGNGWDVGAYEYQDAATLPAIVLTYATANPTVRIGVGGNSGDAFQIDWGDGEQQEHSSASYYTGTVKGNTVKIYGSNILILAATGQGLSNVDITRATSLTRIQLGGNQLKALDVTRNVNLTGIYAEQNQLESIDVSKNAALRVLDVHENKIAGTVDCSAMPSLSSVDVADNQVSSLLLPKHSTLYKVDCGNNLLTALDVTGCSGLDELSCHDNQLTALDLTGVTALTELYAYGNRLTALDPSPCTQLKTLNASDNQLSEIDLSKNTASLEGIYLYDNKLTALDIDANTSVRYINVDNNEIASLNTASQPNLSLLIANNNKLTSIDLTSNTRLSQVKLAHNQLASINVGNAQYLSWLKVDNNQLASLDLSKNAYLYWLECDSNQLATLDLAANTYLQWLAAQGNQLTALDLTACKGLQGLTLQGNNMNAEAINSVIDQLPDVSTVEITDNNRDWGRKLDVSYMPGTKDANVAAAQAKGWTVTAMYDPTGISSVEDGGATVTSRAYYGINGAAYGSVPPASGVYIETTTYSNGDVKSRKVIVKK